LGKVLGELTLLDDRAGQPEHPALVPAHEGRRRVRVADGKGGEEHVVGDLPHALAILRLARPGAHSPVSAADPAP
jgi:hypothetical protein